MAADHDQTAMVASSGGRSVKLKIAAGLLLAVLLLLSSARFAYASTYDGAAVVARAEEELGKPYAWGAVGPAGYDASGLVSYCVTGYHTRIGTTATFMSWPRVSDPQPGDICVSPEHCGIYIGGYSMIHAPTFGQPVSRGSVQPGMIFVRPDAFPVPPNTGDSLPVIPLALCAAASLGVLLTLTRKRKAR